tara:strand:+ start:6031 stop:6480 length:450 start_codon:yes stop_codon:yes gene_type:complete
MRHILLFIFFIFLQGCANPTKDSFIHRGNINKDTILSEEYMSGRLAQVEDYGFNLVYCRNDKDAFCSYLNMPINPIFDNFDKKVDFDSINIKYNYTDGQYVLDFSYYAESILGYNYSFSKKLDESNKNKIYFEHSEDNKSMVIYKWNKR